MAKSILSGIKRHVLSSEGETETETNKKKTDRELSDYSAALKMLKVRSLNPNADCIGVRCNCGSWITH